MISAVQQAKRNALKSSLKMVMLGFTVLGMLFGTAFGVMLGTTFDAEQSLWQSPALLPLVIGAVFLVGLAWYYAKKIDQL